MTRLVKDRTEMLQHVLLHNAVCAEVGVCFGEFAELIWTHTNPAKLHLIDIWADISDEVEWCPAPDRAMGNLVKVSSLFNSPIKDGRAMLHQCRSADVLQLFPDAYFDWVYVDADHSHAGCLKDLLAVEHAIKPGGRIAGHDYATLEQASRVKYYYPGIASAVDEFCMTRGWQIVCLSEQGEYAEPDAGGRNVPSYILQRKLECQ